MSCSCHFRARFGSLAFSGCARCQELIPGHRTGCEPLSQAGGLQGLSLLESGPGHSSYNHSCHPAFVGLLLSPVLRKAQRGEATSQAHTVRREYGLARTSPASMWAAEGNSLPRAFAPKPPSSRPAQTGCEPHPACQPAGGPGAVLRPQGSAASVFLLRLRSPAPPPPPPEGQCAARRPRPRDNSPAHAPCGVWV